jgi:hypothetical protein
MKILVELDPDDEQDFFKAFFYLRDLYERNFNKKMNFYSHIDAERIKREEQGHSVVR